MDANIVITLITLVLGIFSLLLTTFFGVLGVLGIVLPIWWSQRGGRRRR